LGSASFTASSTHKQVLQRQLESWQDLAAFQDPILFERLLLCSRGVNLCRLRFRIDHPDQQDARLKILPKLALNFFSRVGLAQDLDRKLRNDLGNGVIGHVIPAQALPRDEAYIGNADEPQTKADRAVGACRNAKVMEIQVVENSLENDPGKKS